LIVFGVLLGLGELAPQGQGVEVEEMNGGRAVSLSGPGPLALFPAPPARSITMTAGFMLGPDPRSRRAFHSCCSIPGHLIGLRAEGL